MVKTLEANLVDYEKKLQMLPTMHAAKLQQLDTVSNACVVFRSYFSACLSATFYSLLFACLWLLFVARCLLLAAVVVH